MAAGFNFLKTHQNKTNKQVISLLECCYQSITDYLYNLPALTIQQNALFHKYFEFATPFVFKIAEKMNYQWSPGKTTLFIPYILKSGSLFVSDENYSEVLEWMIYQGDLVYYLCAKVSQIHFSLVNEEGEGYENLHILKKFKYLRHLILACTVNNNMLTEIVFLCPNLERLDLRNSQVHITDVGMGYLSHCKTLKSILFCSVSDEFDPDDSLEFSAYAVCLLIHMLPCLERIECPEYILSEGLRLFNHLSLREHCQLKFLFLDSPEAKIEYLSSFLPKICPFVSHLALYIKVGSESLIGNIIKQLPRLTHLKLCYQGPCFIQSLNIDQSNIQYLILDGQFCSGDELLNLGHTFNKVDTLIISLRQFGFIHSEKMRLASHSRIFSNIKKLEIKQRMSTSLFVMINCCFQNIEELHCYNSNINDIYKAVKQITSGGGWKNLQLIALPIFEEEGLNILIHLLQNTAKMNKICIDLCHLNISLLQPYLSTLSRDVIFLDNSDKDYCVPSDEFKML